MIEFAYLQAVASTFAQKLFVIILQGQLRLYARVEYRSAINICVVFIYALYVSHY